jgi:hypothetical protein
LDRSRVNAEDLIASEPDEPAEWHALAALCTIDVWLSVDEVVEGAAALAAVVDSDQTEPCATVPRARAGCES